MNFQQTNDLAIAFIGFNGDNTLSTALVDRVFIDGSPLAETVFRDCEHGLTVAYDLHTHNVIIDVQTHAPYPPGKSAAGPDIGLVKTD